MALSGVALAGLYLFVLVSPSWAELKVNVEDRVDVTLGERAEIPCMIETDGNTSVSFIQWFSKAPGSHSHRESIYFKDSSMRIVDQDSVFERRVSVEDSAPDAVVLIVDSVQLKDELLFICQVNAMAEGSREGTTRLRVFKSPDIPRIEGVHSGIHIHEEAPSKIATCEVKNGYPLPNITWYRGQTPLHVADGKVAVANRVTRDSKNLYTVQSELYLKVQKEDKDASFYCESSYFMPDGMRMAESDSIKITVHYPPTSVKFTKVSPKDLVKEGDTVELRCYADGNPPPPLTFKYYGEDLDEHKLTEDQQGVLLRDVKRRHGGNYSCSALDLEAFDPETGGPETSLMLTVHYLDTAVVQPESPVELSQGATLQATCNALSSLDTLTVWFKDGQYFSDSHILKLVNVSRGSSGEYQCVVNTPSLPGLETHGALEVFVQGQPEITDITQEDQEDMENSVNLTCVVQGYPYPSVTWGASDEQDLDGLSTDTRVPGGVISRLTVKATSKLSVVCEAENEFGKDSRSFTLEPIEPETSPAPSTTTPPAVVIDSTTPHRVQTGLSTTAERAQSTVAPETNITAGSSTKSAGSVTVKPPRRVQKEGSGVIIAVLIICVLLLAILGSVLYFLYKKGKIPCGRSGKQDFTKEKSNKDAIVMEMKTDKSDEAVLLQGVNGEKKAP